MIVLNEETLELVRVVEKKSTTHKLLIFSLGLVIGVLVGAFSLYQKKEYVEYYIPEETIIYKDSLCQDSIKYYTSKIKFGHILYAQILLESGFQSELAVKANNLIGMKLPRKRITTAIGEYKGYAVYGSWKDCVIDYVLWQNSQMKGIKCESAYLDRLSSIYASDTLYREKITKLIEQNKKIN